MAVIQFTGLFQGMKGKIGGGIFQINRGMQILRARTQHNKFGNPSFNTSKKNLAFVSSAWRNLSLAQLATWVAATPNYMTVDKFGNPREPSAFELWCRLNFVYYTATGGFLLVAPVPVPITNIGAVATTWTGGAVLSATYTNLITVDERIYILASPPYSKGRQNPSVKYRTIASMNIGDGLSKAITAQYIAAYGTIPVGTKIFTKYQPISLTTGQEAVPTFTSTIIT